MSTYTSLKDETCPSVTKRKMDKYSIINLIASLWVLGWAMVALLVK
jgi:hypothetical protein